MKTTKPLHVTFTVVVSESEYQYGGRRGEAEMKIQVPRSMVENFDPGVLFVGVLAAALANYDVPDEEDEEESED